jgi:hypothetical protein
MIIGNNDRGMKDFRNKFKMRFILNGTVKRHTNDYSLESGGS